MTNQQKTIRVSPREAQAVLEALQAVRKNRPGGFDADKVDELKARFLAVSSVFGRMDGGSEATTITVERTLGTPDGGNSAFTAYLNGDRRLDDLGKTRASAVGNLVASRKDHLGIEIIHIVGTGPQRMNTGVVAISRKEQDIEDLLRHFLYNWRRTSGRPQETLG